MVGTDPVVVERMLTDGKLICPSCSGCLRPWGWARWRVWRFGGGRSRVRPRRGWCPGCRVTHVLLPVSVLARRADGVAVIGAALVGKAAGAGHRSLAVRLGVAESTVRGWLRRFAARAEDVRAIFTRLFHELDSSAGAVIAAGSAFADAVEVVGLAGAAASRLLGPVDPWQFASAATGGLLLAPGPKIGSGPGPTELINTS